MMTGKRKDGRFVAWWLGGQLAGREGESGGKRNENEEDTAEMEGVRMCGCESERER